MTAIVDSVVAPSEQLDLIWLAKVHADKRLSMRTANGGELFRSVENLVDEHPGPTPKDAHALVDELIRLARLGQRWEQMADGREGPAQ